MKLLIIAISIFIAGCSSAAKKLDPSWSRVNYPIVAKVNSSSALLALSETTIKGVRDLSVDEFEDESVTVKDFEELNSQVDSPMTPEAYAIGSTVVGTSLGLAFKYASGVAVLGYLASSDKPENYGFVSEFNEKGYIYSPAGSDNLFESLVEVIPDAMKSFNQKVDSILKIGLEDDIWSFKKTAKEAELKDGSELNRFVALGSVGNVIDNKKIVSQFRVSLSCQPYLVQRVLCTLDARFTIDKKEHPLVSLLVKEIAQVMPEGSLMYLPPRKDLNRIPMVYKTDGEPMYLVESK